MGASEGTQYKEAFIVQRSTLLGSLDFIFRGLFTNILLYPYLSLRWVPQVILHYASLAQLCSSKEYNVICVSGVSSGPSFL